MTAHVAVLQEDRYWGSQPQCSLGHPWSWLHFTWQHISSLLYNFAKYCG